MKNPFKKLFKKKPKGRSLNPSPQEQARIILKEMFNEYKREQAFYNLESLSYADWRTMEYKIAFINNYVESYSVTKQFFKNGKYNNNKKVV